MSWHVSGTALRAYVDGRVGDADAWSVEAHLVDCERCRAALGAGLPEDSDAAAIVARARTTMPDPLPAQGRVRAAGRWRAALLLTSSGPAARTAWLVSVVVVLVMAVAMDAVWRRDGLGFDWLTLVAPLLPVAGVATAYGSALDEPGEIIASTPSGGLRLLLWRTLAVLAVSVPAALLAGVWAAGSPAAWLLPALALTALTLAAGSITGIAPAAVTVGVGWLLVVAAPAVADRAAGPLVDPAAAGVWVPLTALSAAVVGLRATRFAHHIHRPSREA